MFLNQSQITEIKNLSKRLKIKPGSSDTLEYTAFKLINSLLERVEKLEKEFKKLKPDN
jgi:hypothetical protein